MSIVKMKRIALIGLDVEKNNLMNHLMDFGAMELTEQNHKMQDELWANSTSFEDNKEVIGKLEARINRAQAALEVLEKYGEMKSPLFKTRRPISREKYDKITNYWDIDREDVEKVMKLQDEVNAINDRINVIEQDLFFINPWLEYDLPMNLSETGMVNFRYGYVDGTVDTDLMIKRFEDEIGEVVMKVISRDKNMCYIAMASHKAREEDVLALLKEFGFNRTTIEMLVGTPQESLKMLTEEREAELQKLQEVKDKIIENTKLKNNIEAYMDAVSIELEKYQVRENLLLTKKTFFMEGWVPAKSADRLARILDESGCFYEIRDPEEGENVPVLLKNSSFFMPLESITEMYSLPDYRGFDPTSIFALFYICFFGMMFSDAGYGLMLSIGCYVILKKFDLEGNMYRMIKMFMYCGVATIFWGVMFGGFFGDLISAFSRTFLGHEVVVPAVWFNPLDDPMTLLVFSLILGVIHLFIGMGINAYMEIRDGHVLDAIFGEGAWFVTIPGLVLLLCGSMVGIEALTPIGKVMSIVGVIMLIIGGARGKKGFGRITGAFSNVYSITSWMSDILSYARLLALGLATGVIAQVVNVMGTLFGGGVAGLILFILIFAVGTAINFAINVLGAFIHSARLQYVEFFGKFYRDGGDAFKPFKKETKYIRVEDKADN